MLLLISSAEPKEPMSLREILNLSCSFLKEVAFRLDLCGLEESPLIFTYLNLSNLLKKVNSNIIGTVLNGIEENRGNYYYYYGEK